MYLASLLASFLVLVGPTIFHVTSQDVTFSAGSLGLIGGSLAKTIGKSPKNYTQFLGIPFAYSPPRFQPSVLKEDRLSSAPNEVFNATSFGAECPQPFPNEVGETGNEDCLFLNVFTPEVLDSHNITSGPITTLRPVIVFIHGAAFVSGNANAYTGARLLNRDLVLVSFNYRLGVFGFLNLNIPEAPGNAALYDAYSCLEWVQKFIHHFGGDPNRVTLAGQSSGSATVSHMMLQGHRSSGLFHKVIAASGSALDVWATSSNPVGAAVQVATFAGCYTPGNVPNVTEIHGCLLTKNQSEIIMAQNTVQYLDRVSGGNGFSAVNPSIQLASINGSLITTNPQDILESSQQMNIPLMMSATREDGGFALRLFLEGYIIPNNLTDKEDFFRHDFIPLIISAYGVHDMNHAMANTFRQLYLSNEIMESGNFTLMVPGLMDMLGVLFFKSASHRTVQLHQTMNNSTYFYSFEYEGQYTRQPDTVPFPGGVAHADDLIYLFLLSEELDENETTLSGMMVDYWANFATSGNPNSGDSISSPLPQWNAVNAIAGSSSYLRIHKEKVASQVEYSESWIIANKPEVVSETCSRSSTFSQMLSPISLCILLGLLIVN